MSNFDDHIKQLVREAVREELNSQRLNDRLLSRKELIQRLGCAPSTFDITARKLTPYIVGHSEKKYLWSEVLRKLGQKPSLKGTVLLHNKPLDLEEING